MEQPSIVERSAISARLKALGKDRAWLAQELHVSEGVVNQWLSARGNFPQDRHVAVKLLLDKAENPVGIGDPDGNLISFTIEEFERIEATRQSLHYDTRPALYRDAIIAFVEADEATQAAQAAKVLPMSSGTAEMRRVAEDVNAPPVEEARSLVEYPKGKRERK